MANFEVNNGIAIIPEGTTTIDERAFENCIELKSVVIPEGVTEIGYKAFCGCSSLRSIEIPSTTTKIGWGILNNCPELESITVAEGNPVLDSREACNAIIRTESNILLEGCKSTVIPSSVTTIGVDAFAGCTGLRDILIPDSVTTIKANAFYGCTGLTKIVIPASVEEIECYDYNNYGGIFFQPFSGCSNLASIIVNEGNTEYDSRENCNAIIKSHGNVLAVGCAATVIPQSVTQIGQCAFAGSQVTDVHLPDSVRKLNCGAFADCVSLKSLILGKGLWAIAGRDDYFGKPSALKNCKNLETIILPASLDYIGTSVFEGCDKLCNIVVEDGNVHFDSRDNCNAVIFTAENKLVAGCQTSIIPETVTKIGEHAFGFCNSLTDITVPENVTEMDDQIFRSCTGLKSAAILGPVKDIRDPFVGCESLETVTFGAGIKKMDEDILENAPALKCINVPAKKSAYYKKRLPESVHDIIVEQ